MLKKLGIAVLGALLVLGAAAPNGFAAEKILKMGIGDPEDSDAGAFAKKFKQIVEEKTNGKVDVQLFPNCSLGDEGEMFQNVRRGTLDMTCIGVGNAVPFVSPLGVYTLPYLLKNDDQVVKATTGELFDYFNDVAKKRGGVRILGNCYTNFRHLTNSVRPVTKLEDVKGLKIRVPASKINVATYKAWDANPVPMGWAETFTALQQGVVDGQDNPYVVNNSVKMQEVQRYLTELHHQYSLQPLFIGEKTFESLSPELQKILVDAGMEAQMYMIDWQKENSQKAREAMEKAGVKVSTLEDEPEWEKRARAVWPEFYEFVGGKEVIDKVLKAIGEDQPAK